MTNKTITVKVPDDIPDPEFSILARCKGTFDEWESVEYEEAEMFLNMQYYYEYCIRFDYVTPQEWLEEHKHF